MTNPTPVAWMYNFRPYGRDSEPLAIGWLSTNRAEAFGKNCKDQQPLFTAAQLNQARADALREAAAIFDQKHTQLKHCHNYHQCTARDLRAMAAEIEGEKK